MINFETNNGLGGSESLQSNGVKEVLSGALAT